MGPRPPGQRRTLRRPVAPRRLRQPVGQGPGIAGRHQPAGDGVRGDTAGSASTVSGRGADGGGDHRASPWPRPRWSTGRMPRARWRRRPSRGRQGRRRRCPRHGRRGGPGRCRPASGDLGLQRLRIGVAALGVAGQNDDGVAEPTGRLEPRRGIDQDALALPGRSAWPPAGSRARPGSRPTFAQGRNPLRARCDRESNTLGSMPRWITSMRPRSVP